jgi:ATP-dependent protease ClpP protease subunit
MNRWVILLLIALIPATSLAGLRGPRQDELQKAGCSPDQVPKTLGENTFDIGGCLFLEDEITDATFTRLLEAIGSKKIRPYGVLFLNSPGGSVKAAISIGRELRRMHISAFVIRASECTSACVFVLAGAVSRQVSGRIGLHRPYSQNLNLEFDQAKASVTEMNQIIVRYLEEMNVPVSLYNKMKLIPPEEVEYFTGTKYLALGIPEVDPVQDEFMRSLHAQSLGLTKQEYVRRAKAVIQFCNKYLASIEDVQLFYDCRRRIMGGG